MKREEVIEKRIPNITFLTSIHTFSISSSHQQCFEACHIHSNQRWETIKNQYKCRKSKYTSNKNVRWKKKCKRLPDGYIGSLGVLLDLTKPNSSVEPLLKFFLFPHCPLFRMGCWESVSTEINISIYLFTYGRKRKIRSSKQYPVVLPERRGRSKLQYHEFHWTSNSSLYLPPLLLYPSGTMQLPPLRCRYASFEVVFGIVQLAHPCKRKLIIKRGRERRGWDWRRDIPSVARSSRYGDRHVGVSSST